MNNHFLSLIVPAFKKEKTIISNIKRLQKVLNTIRYDYEIIIVVDGILDNTFDMLRSARLKKVTILAYKTNQGKSYAIRLGMQFAKGDYVMFTDAGEEIDPNGISMLLEHVEWYDADIVVGSKRHPASIVNYNLQRKILSFGYYYFVKLFFGINVKDTQAGIKIYRKRVLKKILPRLVEKRFVGDLEILVVAKKLGFQRVFEAPIKMNYDVAGLSSAVSIKSIYFILLDTLAIFYRDKMLKYYEKPHRRINMPGDLKIVKNN